MKLILASQSPRRRDILNWMGIPFETDVCTDPEKRSDYGSAEETVKKLALHKSVSVQKMHPDDYILAADTIVELDGDMLGKPSSPQEAKSFLMRLSGKTHTVYTGVALLHRSYSDVRSEATLVTFCDMTMDEIEWYVSTGDPLDKAGAYGIQGIASAFVRSIHGNYFNVIGLPAPVVYSMLLQSGFLSADRRELR